MINVSNDFKERMKEHRDFRNYAQITFADGSEMTVDASVFTSSNNSLMDGASASGFPLGVAVSKTAQIELINDEQQYATKDFLGAKIRLYIEFATDDEGTVERIEKGTYTVITPETYGETVIITAYDDMYKADKDYTTAFTFPQTAGAVLRDICATCDISLGSTSFLHDNFQIQNKPTGKFREVIGQIAMIACGNARIDRQNRLQIISYDLEWGYNANVVAGENLFIDKNSIRGWINNSGTVTVQDPYRATDYISVSEGDILIFQLWRPDSASTWWGRTFFDKDKAFVQGTYTSTYITTDHIVEKIVIPQGVSFVRVSYAFASGFKIKIEKGNTATAYIPNVADDVNPYMLLDEFTAPKIEYNDTVITGFKTIIKGETSEEDTEILQGTDTYCITVENPLISGQEKTVLSWLLERIGNVPFRPFSGDAISNPLVEFMDLAKVKDRRGNEYNTFVTDVNFLMPGYTTLKNSTPSATRSAIAYTSNSARVEQRARQLVELEKNARELAVERLQEALAQGSGLYPTEERQPDGSTIYYLHDKPTKAESKVVIKLTSEGIGISQNGGKDYPWGITFTGQAILDLIYAVGINCDYLTTGAITVKDNSGNIIFQVDMDTKSVTISGDHVRIGGKSATTALADNLTEAKNYSDGKLSDYANTVSKSITGLQEQIDGQIETFYYDYEPSLLNVPASAWTSETERQKHQGDLFYNKKTGYAYRFFKDGSTWKWQLIQDTDITKAMQTAETAKDTADHKRRVFVVTPEPPYDIGDLWTNGTDVLTCAVARAQGAAYVSSDWQKLNKYTDDTVANQALDEARKSTNLTIILDNEYQGIPTDSTGKYSGTLSVSTIVQTYYGHQNVSATCTYTFQKSDGVTYTWDGATRKCTITALTTDTGWVDITANYMNLFTVTKRFNVAKIKAGAQGINLVLESDKAYTNANYPTHVYNLSEKAVKGETYTVTVWGALGNGKAHFGAYFGGGTYRLGYLQEKGDGVYSVTGTCPLSTADSAIAAQTLQIYPLPSDVAVESTINKIKLEHGSVETPVWTPAPQDLVGPQGPAGKDGKGVSSTKVEYQVSSSGGPTPPTTWQSTVPTTSAGQYLWTKTEITYTDTTKSTMYSVSRNGNNGAAGAAGKGISSITNYYLATTKGSGVTQSEQGWSTNPAAQPLTATNKYLWNYEVTAYTDGTNTTIAPHIIGVYGDKGATGGTGAAGAAGKGIKSIDEYYATSTGTTAPAESLFKTGTPPTLSATNKYLWNYEVITYTDNTTYKSDKRIIGAFGDTGATGAQGEQGINLFGFNKGIILQNMGHMPTTKFDESINGICVTINAADNNLGLLRIMNLGYEGISGYYTVSGEIYATNNFNCTVDMCGCGEKNLSVTSQSQKFVLSANVTKYHKPTDFNGFVDLRTTALPPVGTSIYLKNLKVERGQIANPIWTPAPQDLIGPAGKDGAPGKDGAAGRTYFIELTANVLKRGANNVITPGTITARAYYRDGTSATRVAYAGRWRVETSTDGTTFNVIAASSSTDESSKTYTVSTLATSVVAVRFTLYAAGGTTTALDMQTVPILIDVAALTHEQIFNLLTNNGAMKGIYQEGNQLYISFTYAKGGALTLGGINNGNGRMSIRNTSDVEIGYIDNTGCHFNNGYFSGELNVTSGNLCGYTLNATKFSKNNSDGKLMFELAHDESQSYLRLICYDYGYGNAQQSMRISSRSGIQTSDSNSMHLLMRAELSSDLFSDGSDHSHHLGGTKFYGNVDVNGDFKVTGGYTKSIECNSENYGKQLFYSYEYPSPMLGDVGDAVIAEDGTCYVDIDDIFRECTSTMEAKYYVFLQKEGEGEAYVAERTATYFVVKGTPGLPFAFEIKVRQKGMEHVRFTDPGRDPAAGFAPADYDELWNLEDEEVQRSEPDYNQIWDAEDARIINELEGY